MVRHPDQTGNIALITIFVVIVLAAAGYLFLGKGKSISPGMTPSPSAMAPAQTGGTPEDLTFTGVVSGHMTSGRKGDTYLCSTTATGPIVGKIGDTDYTFEYRALGAKGPGTVNAYVQIGPLANKNLYYGGDNVKLTINADTRSGSVEGDLTNLNNSAEKVHVTGNYTCPPDY